MVSFLQVISVTPDYSRTISLKRRFYYPHLTNERMEAPSRGVRKVLELEFGICLTLKGRAVLFGCLCLQRIEPFNLGWLEKV